MSALNYGTPTIRYLTLCT